jgi:hypothetical protein
MSIAEPTVCSEWEEITPAFDSFPHPKLGYGLDQELSETLWVFRGHKSTNYRLESTVERVATKKAEWASIELKVLEEFRSLARMHLSQADIPEPEDKLSWLALMQHYGVPTRLLDFTLSPYVALYFALINRTPEELGAPAEVWAIDAGALTEIAKKESWGADKEEKEVYEREHGKVEVKIRGASLVHFATDADRLEEETRNRGQIIAKALSPSKIREAHFNRNGFVTLAMPPVQNRRLSSQQGTFLFNGAKELNFHDSLFRMMNDCKATWCKRIRITGESLMDIERQLFRRNIHNLSLFPDIQGLAGFIRQKTRLHWIPDDSPYLEEP